MDSTYKNKAALHEACAREQCSRLLEQAVNIRNAQMLSQRDVATLIGLQSRGNLAQLEQKKVVPRLDRFLRLLSVYGYTLEIVPKATASDTDTPHNGNASR